MIKNQVQWKMKNGVKQNKNQNYTIKTIKRLINTIGSSKSQSVK